MAKARSIAKLIFWPQYDQRCIDEAKDRGCLSHVLVEVDGIRLYPVDFYDPDRLQGDLREMSKQGEPFIAEVGMIVVPEVTMEMMQNAVQRLCDRGFFNYFVPVSTEQLAKNDPFAWPPKL